MFEEYIRKINKENINLNLKDFKVIVRLLGWSFMTSTDSHSLVWSLITMACIWIFF